MGVIFFTGGARSGKSDAAEAYALHLLHKDKKIKCAVFGDPNSNDNEFLERIKKHQEKRPKQFLTLECYKKLYWYKDLQEDEVLVLDCLGTALTSIMNIKEAYEPDDPKADEVRMLFKELIQFLSERKETTIVVSNEVGAGVVPVYASARWFRDTLGRANKTLVEVSDEAYFCVCGKLIELTNLPDKSMWE